MMDCHSISGMYIILNLEGDNFYHGMVDKKLSDNHYTVQLFSAVSGCATSIIVTTLDDIASSKSELYGDRESFVSAYEKRIRRLADAHSKRIKDEAEILYEWLANKIKLSDPSWAIFHINDLGKNGPVRTASKRNKALQTLVEDGKLHTEDFKTFSVVM